MWFAIAMAASQAYQGRQAHKRSTQDEAAKYQRDLKYVEARNKAAIQAAAETTSRINVERAGLHRQVRSAMVALKVSKLKATGVEQQNAAASGAGGASSQAALADIERQADAAQGALSYNLAVGEDRLNNMLADSWDAASASMMDVPMRPSRAGSALEAFSAVAGAAAKGYNFGASLEPASTPAQPAWKGDQTPVWDQPNYDR